MTTILAIMIAFKIGILALCGVLLYSFLGRELRAPKPNRAESGSEGSGLNPRT